MLVKCKCQHYFKMGLLCLLLIVLSFPSFIQPATAATLPVGVINAPSAVASGQGLLLDGSRSTAMSGRSLRRYVWTNISEIAFGNMSARQSFETTYPALTLSSYPPAQVGRYTFQLVVGDETGSLSTPVTASVIVTAPASVAVADRTAPTAVLDVPTIVSQGQTFNLDARRSSDVGGRVVKYVWTCISVLPIGRFTPNLDITTDTPTLEVTTPTQVGKHTFRLIVVDDSGNASAPTTASVSVVSNATITIPQKYPSNGNKGIRGLK